MKMDLELIDGWLQSVAVAGELDAYTAPRLLEAVAGALDAGHEWLLVDLGDVQYIDSVGLGILIGGAKRAAERNGDLSVACSRPNVRRVFDVSGTAELLNVVDTVDEAVAILSEARAAQGGREQ